MDTANSLADLRIDRTRKRSSAGTWIWLLLVLLVLGGLTAVVIYPALQVTTVGVASAAAVWPTGAKDGAKEGGSGAIEELSATGYVVADRQSVLAAKVTGRLTKLNVAEAQFVEQGHVVAEVDHTELDAQILAVEAERRETVAETERLKRLAAQELAAVEAAKEALPIIDAQIRELSVTLADAERRLERDKKLVLGLAMPASEVDDRVTEVKLAQAQIATAGVRRNEAAQRIVVAEKQAASAAAAVGVAEARALSIDARLNVLRAQLKDYFVLAPFDGVVSEKAAEVGEIVAPISVGGQMARGSVATLADWQSLQAEVDVSESQIGLVRAGQRAAITVDAIPNKTFPGKVRRILPRADRSKATVKVRVDFIERDEKAILPEMGIRVRFLPDNAPEGLERGLVKPRVMVPAQAIRSGEKGAFVWVLSGETAARRAVKTGATEDGRTEITEGLASGEKVITTNGEKLNGDAPRIRVEDAKK